MNVKKRNGIIVKFDKTKITDAIRKAVVATRGDTNTIDLNLLTDHVLKGTETRYAGYKTPDVEGIQDIVESSIMEFKLYDVAKAYILYRERHREMREAREKAILQQIDNGLISVTKRDGQKEKFDENKLRQHLAKAFLGYEGVANVEDFLRQCELGVYDGIKSSDIAKLAILTARSYIEYEPMIYSTVTTRLFLSFLYSETLSEKSPADTVDESYARSFVNSIDLAVKQGTLTNEMLGFDLKRLAGALKRQRDELIEYRGLQTLYDRYFIKDKRTKTAIETPQFFWMRVAMGLSLNERDRNETAMKFYEIISLLRFVPSTPTLFHSGTLCPQLSSCYLTTVEDDLHHIFKAISDNAQLSKWSGGLGNDWTNVRATGSLIKSTQVESQGVIPFLKIASDATVAINRSGKRRGATCAYLETWHLDIEDYIDLRRTTGDERRRTQDMDTAHWIPDLFIKRVMADADWTLFSPNEVSELHQTYGKTFEEKYLTYEEMAKQNKLQLFKTMKAKTLWRKMITSLFETSHPWMVFKDPANIRSPQDHTGTVHSSNLCTEITLNTSKEETAVCNLGSLNLAQHIRNGKLDTELLRETVLVAMRMLDNVIDICYYPTAEARTSNLRHRPVGLGIMGYQDALYMLDMKFDSPEALKFADESMEAISYYAIFASTELARERGAYETFKGSKWDRRLLPLDTMDLLEKERGVAIDVERTAKMDWSAVRAAIKKYGMRNSNCMAIAPTATISNIAGCFPSIEPIYKNIYVKSNMSGEFTVINRFLVDDLKALGLWSKTMLEKIKEQNGNIQNIHSIPQHLKDKYKEAFDIDPRALIKAAAYRGKWIDQSQSLNLFTSTNSGNELSNIYIYAWKMGLKSTYYLRTTAASSVEKSTLEITNRTAATSVDDSSAVTAPENLAQMCRLDGHVMTDGQECEACQ
jgi:ribonucleoside-diphosphate reductase alpha chain